MSKELEKETILEKKNKAGKSCYVISKVSRAGTEVRRQRPRRTHSDWRGGTGDREGTARWCSHRGMAHERQEPLTRQGKVNHPDHHLAAYKKSAQTGRRQKHNVSEHHLYKVPGTQGGVKSS